MQKYIALLICALLLAGLYGCTDSTGGVSYDDYYVQPAVSTPEPTPPDIEISAETQAAYKTITPAEVQALLDGDDAADVLLLDVRLTGEFMPEHIAGARSLPNVQISDTLPDDLDESFYRLDATVIVYGADAAQSRDAALKLIQTGYKNVYDMGAITLWQGKLVSG